MRALAFPSALELALPALDEITPITPSSPEPAEALRLSPLETTVMGPSPWCDEAAPASTHLQDALFAALELRARDARGTRRPSAAGLELDAQLDAVLSMTACFASLEALSAVVSLERGRWLRA